MKKALITLFVSAASASAFSLDFVKFDGQQLDSSSSFEFFIPGYGFVEIQSANNATLEVNNKFTITPPGTPIVTALEFDDTEEILITFKNGDPSRVSYSFVNDDAVGEEFIERIVNIHPNETYSLRFVSSANTAGLQNITWEAVPEPSSTLLAGLGGLALIVRRRR